MTDERFGIRVRRLREAARLTLRAMAREMGWSAPHQSDVELGRRNPPSIEKIRKMADLIGADADELIELADLEKRRVVISTKPEETQRTRVALSLARSWDGLTDEQVSEIERIVRRDNGGRESD